VRATEFTSKDVDSELLWKGETVNFVIAVETWTGRLKSMHSGLAARASGNKMATMIGWRAIMIQSRFGLFWFSLLFEMRVAKSQT
jgi:hypothetical protein